MPEELLSGWGHTAPSLANVYAPRNTAEVEQLLTTQRKVIARGLGRSYGDPAQAAGGSVISNRNLWHLGQIDTTAHLVTAGAGVSIDELLTQSVPAGYTLPVTPGTRQVTLGGALAADVHGKNHHRDGSFADHVTSFVLATPTGTFTVSKEEHPEVFWATAGGMGATGIVTELTLRLTPIETSYVLVDSTKHKTLESVMAAMVADDHTYHYSVAWVDCMRYTKNKGRAVLTRGQRALQSDLTKKHATQPLRPPSRPLLDIPFTPPSGLVNKRTMRLFNEAWYQAAPRSRYREPQSDSTFFHPLDGLSNWNHLHGTRGFTQYQFVVPDENASTVQEAILLLEKHKVPSFLAVLKRFGPGNPGLLSFPTKGWTLALDMPMNAPGLSRALDELDECVLLASGRLYLAKDARMSPETFAASYPRRAEFLKLRDTLDPNRVLHSDLFDRLGLYEADNNK